MKTTGDWVDESWGLGEAIVKNLSAVTGMKSLGCRVNNRYMSLNWITTPTVLVEMGFISSAIEDRYMASDKGREEAAYGIFEGLCEYFGR